MFPRKKKIILISELSPQNEGDIDLMKTMILQSKMAGADLVKIQVYDSVNFLGDDRKKFGEINKQEFRELFEYASMLGIPLFASCFDEERLAWSLDIGCDILKIPSKIYNRDKKLVEKCIETGKTVFISNGLDPMCTKYAEIANVRYFHCVAKYPALLEDVKIPDFELTSYKGYSDHTIGLTACKVAVSRGAKFIEKHFTVSKAMQSSINKAHSGAMSFDELMTLRAFCDDFVRMNND